VRGARRRRVVRAGQRGKRGGEGGQGLPQALGSKVTPAATSGYVPVDGTDVYFEVRGEGDPVLMIHGAFASGHAFRPLLPRLADDRAAVGRRLGPEGCSVVGCWWGGGAAQQLAVRHPDPVRRLVVISAPCRQDGWHADVLAGFRSVRAASMPDFEGTEMYRNH